jgi:prevent-host-death family protein
MTTLDAKAAGAKLDRILDEAAEAHRPVLITSPRANAVLVSEADWNAMQETLYLLSVPGMRESIREGLATPLEECEKEPGW